MVRFLGLVALFGALVISEGQVIQAGQCDTTVAVQAGFDATQFIGVWYENSRTSNEYQSADCSTFEFTSQGNQILSVTNNAVNRNFFEQNNGTATYTAADPARMTLTLSSFPNAIDFWILLTDYQNFALAYSCENIGTTNRAINLWKLGRSSTYINELIPALMDTLILNTFGITSSESLTDIDHGNEGCYVLPIIAANTPVVIPGQCDDNIAVVQNFDAGRFVGRWHEISSYFSESATGSCPTANYAANADGSVAVDNTQVVNQFLETISGSAVVASTDGSAVLDVTLEVIPGVFAVQRLYVLASDYDNYAVTYSCVNVNAQEKRVYSWIVSRTKQLSAASAVAVQAVVDSILDLNDQYYAPADQSDDGCFYYPVHVVNQPVVFPGSCDLNIPAMPNFNPVLYQGLWHEIEAYPSAFQQGTCNNAFYTLNDAGYVDVYNTQVIGQALNDIYGIATVASDDGTAKLEVVFPVEGTNFNVTTSYWVLDTDYTSYALVYTCEDLGDDQRGVWSWKLSRNKQLSQAASTIMDNIINTIPVLDARYFQVRDQSVDGCFYIPEAVPGQQVVFPGQCDNSIAAVPNFNLEQFQGTWYEIEAYPKDDQPGQCISHEYSPAVGSLSLVSNQIIDQFLYSSNGSLTFSSTDGSARLTINIVVDGEAIEIPFWILSTDYTSYALAYSCVNINEDFRGIFSWKLSRTRALTVAANTAINTAIAPIEVLDNIYYEQTDHSDEACFFLPELAPGESVILVGQCDLSIPAVPNFDAQRYTGYWRLLESYPSNFQTGGCNDANYTLLDGFVLVFNTQVINQTLDTITGQAVVSATDGTGKLAVTFPVAGTTETVTLEYWILDTDYDSYALVYSCLNINAEQRQIWSWKLGRSRTFTTEAYNNMNAVINTVNVLNNRYYEVIEHTDDACFYYPEPVAGEPVMFRGQCDLTIPTVPGFDAVAYMGLWHEIQGYPSLFQQGTCNNAFYTLDAVAGVVDVYNTQVIGQVLFDIYGTAVPVSDDGKLEVSFPIEGTDLTAETSYWVLSTDYTTYALIYTCENINEEYRTVWSWKLSRTKALTAAANTAINAVVATIPVLDDRYYEPKDQSPEGCFYFPEVTGEPVMFPGVCDTTIPTVANLDVERFAGLWYEFSAYPKNEQLGTCVNYDFSVTSNLEFGLISTQVIGLDLDITNANLVRTSADNSAFTITFNSNGTVITIPYWILDTDYDNYALAYSCVNYENDMRGVFSWKLSRTKELTAASNAAITTAISNIEVLDERYFQTTGQSDDNCFYLPDITLSEAVIFPGQCDQTIPTVQNFDPFSYEGQWYDIESYYDTFQEGTCNDALYTVNAAGTVDVYNTQVVNQTLDFINGIAETTDESGKLIVTFPVAGTDFTISTTYWILSTDYVSYSLVYSCTNLTPDTRRVYSWKLSRTRSLTEQAQATINGIINQINVLDDRYFISRDHSDEGCFYYPEPVIGQAVTFRGQCDETVAAVPNFDVAAYTGFWYDVGSYPQEFQFGTCATATYTLNTELGVVEVYNTQVTNQTLDFINGIAEVDPEGNGSGKLLVTFPIAGTDFNIVSPYWVLATDYVSYSLVYTCINITPETRRVTSWKLSRQPTLTAAGNTAINNVINNVQVLDEQYYQEQSHSEESCFYYPEPAAGQPVVFPGTCDDGIQAVPNFDLQSFSGLWHEVAAYPKIEQAGECVNYEFGVQSADTLSMISTQVIGLDLDVTTGTLVRTSTDNSARFTITINVNNTQIVIPYWIVATDYQNYALAYSCVNYDNGFRGVWSWKLSRDKQISALSQTAISQTIDLIQVLEERYYEDASQTDESCFYLPDITNQEPAVFPGQCDQSIPTVQNFDPFSYEGQWYDIESYYDNFQEGTCNDALYTVNAAGTVDVYNTQVINQTLDFINGIAETTDESGKLIVTFPVAGTDFTISTTYWILSTDYVSYSLVYSCTNLTPDTRRVYSWKLSRTRSLTEQAQAIINGIVNQINVLDARYFIPRDHSDEGCFYYPEPVIGQAVTFRGQCDETVAAVPNFDVAAYTGFWYDVGSYPQEFQFGTCATATYTLNAELGVVEVYNTQVTNQTLDFINGIAEVDPEANGSGKLLVTFPIAGTDFNIVSPYWILATDYVSYSLVYTCINITPETRRVTSWILSRQPTLSAAGNTAINNVINNVQVLDERYYQEQSHSEESCFYYPEPAAGQPVVFPGTCDDTIQAVPNFDLQSFSGLWHEVSAYPKIEQAGECVNYEFSVQSADTLGLISTQVIGLDLDITTGSLVRTSTDNSARFTITINVNNTNIVIPYWIVATDYENYALAYSCVNYDNGFRGVWSWKLSRDQQLSALSQTAISPTIDAIEVLDERYYEVTPQTDEACFYLPDITTDEPAIFPGQCDQSIPAVANFDPVRYQGRWYDVASYYDQFQLGTCNDAEYTLNAATGVVDVFNTQVIDEVLDTITGTAVLASTDGSGKLLVTFPVAGTDFTIDAEYWVLDTDYDSYSLVYSCSNLENNQRRVFSWKLSRARQLAAAAETAINNIINQVNVLADRYYIQRNHTEEACFYYPDPVPGQAVNFRGQCDENVQALQNFDVLRYTGLWYDMGSYPQEFQFGTCPTATYTFNEAGGFVDVYNTQVINQQLDDINGEARLVSTDGSAQLVVTFPIAGTNLFIDTPYWVLATDYEDYALVYSCVNTGVESYRVTSWKLSRTQTISATAASVFTQTFDSVKVLDERYFESRGHSEEDCFFYPDNNGGPVYLEGQCDANQNVVTNFNANLFAGTWYEQARFPSELQEGECSSSEIEVTNQQITITQTFVFGERLETVEGVLTVPADGSGMLTATFNYPGGVEVIPVYVLDTDYTSYALLFSCRDDLANSRKQVFSWKLSRARTGLTDQAIQSINNIVSSNPDLFELYYDDTDQGNDGCFHYPVFDDDAEIIVFPGPCDETIQGVANFDAAGYLGRWFEISAYPAGDTQVGQCARAEYSLGDAGVDIYHTVVDNQTLEIVTGVATLATTDGSGVLDVVLNLPFGDVFANYYILATDYTNYALIYSCRNQEDGNRQVTSWKLSRQPTLAPQFDAIINTVIENTQGLLEEYYQPTSQTDEDCFYIPELNVFEPVVFRGQCADISGVANFNVQNYLGWWHEIEAYPTGTNNGYCRSAQISANGNQFGALDISVFGEQDFAYVSSNLEITADGRLRRIGSNGEVTDVWVLATDYETYSLLYSCENINDEYRRVWSAKHSKSRSLTAQAQTTMQAIINTNEVLVSDFYLPVDQSDAACFHYPEQSGQRIIIPGQCDDSIPVVTNFDAVQYTGTWYQIEKYPQQWESGTCVGARYALDEETGIVDVLNWEVIDGELDTIEGTGVVTSTDGSARLLVTLPIVGTDETTDFPLYVLSTDYISYSLAYSCENINEFQRAIGAWKLSRTRTMPASGVTAIANVVAQRPELHEPYFEITEHNDECEEPSAGYLVSSSMIVLVVCAVWQILLH